MHLHVYFQHKNIRNVRFSQGLLETLTSWAVIRSIVGAPILSDLLGVFCILLDDFSSLYCNKDLKLWSLLRPSFQSCDHHFFLFLLKQQVKIDMSTQQTRCSHVSDTAGRRAEFRGTCFCKWKIKSNGKRRRTPEIEENQFGHLVGVASSCRKQGLIIKMNGMI